MPAFVKTLLLDAPVDDDCRFVERGNALSLLTPAFPPVRIISRTGGINRAVRVEPRVGLSCWDAQHNVCERICGGKTRLADRIDYELPGGSLVNTVFGWTVSLGRRKMFAHRHRVTKGVCEKRSVGEAL